MNGLDHFENKVKEAIQKSEVPYLGLVDDLLTNDARSFVELALIKSGGQLRNFEKGLKIAPALFVGYISSILRLHLGADTSAVYGCLNIAMGKPADSNQTNEEREGLWRAFRSASQKLGLPLSSRHFGPNYMVDAYLEQAGIPEAGMPELIKRMDIYAKKYGLPELGDVLPTLLNPLRRKVKQVSADGAYDTKKCHKLLKRRGCKPTIPPRKNAGYWEEGHPRNEAVSALKSDELKQWKQENDYHQRSLSETAMYRYKQLISPKLSLRDYNGQVGEALAGVKVMNKVIGLGMPIRQRVN